MKNWKLTSGIVSIVLAVFVFFQSSMAGLYNALAVNGESSGTTGFIMAIGLLAGGICSIVFRKADGDTTRDSVLAILFGIPGVLAMFTAGSYGDLYIWATWGIVCAGVAIADIMAHRNKDVEKIEIDVNEE